MKRILLLVALFSVHLALKAQKVYFIYLQSETAAPFYIKMAGKIQSSTTEGYLIIPSLVDSTYLVTVGQPGKQEEPQFSITINRGDRGFLIKNFDGTPGLFDLQTLSVYKPVTSAAANVPTVPRNDNFTKLLAKAADDTTLLNQPVVVQQTKPKPKETKPQEAVAKENTTPKTDAEQQTSIVTTEQAKNNDVVAAVGKDTVAQNSTSSASVVKDTVAIAKKEEPSVVKKEEASVKKEDITQPVEQEYKRSIVTKKSESSTSEGFGLTFLDNDNGVIDTVQLTIPNPKMVWVDTAQKQQPTETRQFLEVANEKDSVKKDTIMKSVETAAAAKQKPQCNTLSTDDDFFRLRRDMAAKSNEDEMIAQAKKYFKSKCYRTEQIKYLSTLFLTDEGKYRFFDAAYMRVSDQERFASLQSEIQDSYYLNRFKALIGN